MLLSVLKKLRLLPVIVAAAASISSCHSAREVIYIQNATPDAVNVIEQAANVTVRPGDEISIVVTSTDDHATAQLNLLIDSRRLAKRGSDIKGSPITNGAGQNNLMDYVVDSKGDIDFPLLGEIHVAGLTRDQIAATIKREILNKGLLKDDKDLTVTVSFSNLIYTTLGEVQHPGAYAIDRDRITLLEALGRSGDLTIYGRRDRVWVIREEGGERKTYKVDLRSTDFMQSPAYYVQQNDVIYVEPNETRTGQSTVNENTFKSVGFWTSITSVLISIATLVVTLTR